MNFSLWGEMLPSLLSGLWVSLKVAGASLALGLPGAMLLALASTSARQWVRRTALVVTEIGRGVPALVVLQLIYFGLPSVDLTLSSFAAGTAALAWMTAAYTSEIIRGGLEAVHAGQREAGLALGMSNADVNRYVLIPQGLRIAIPPVVGFAILVFQTTSLCFVIGLSELLSRAYSEGAKTFEYLTALGLAGVLYAAVAIPASLLVSQLEKRLATHALDKRRRRPRFLGSQLNWRT